MRPIRDFSREAGRVQDALDLREQVLAARERILGGDHPDTVTTRNRLAALRDAAADVQQTDTATPATVPGVQPPQSLEFALVHVRADRRRHPGSERA
ncbi:tetratricopeptide repeat protein [Streptomyces sp. NPDC050759]|uniref:tetratricopeptide repeat protein n=1 Tax=Streptomyces sp. NPDC050759 TaxID=3365635 RepID=UPI00378F6410